MRGEKSTFIDCAEHSPGSPPLARGKVYKNALARYSGGITPACAGKRLKSSSIVISSRNHPRLRGEKRLIPPETAPVTGSPPLARGKGAGAVLVPQLPGITPACAGKRVFTEWRNDPDQDHPRLRGEKRVVPPDPTSAMGSPPLARGKGGVATGGNQIPGITPACAGKRRPGGSHISNRRDHPRLRGEKSSMARLRSGIRGSPPLARGKVQPRHDGVRKYGITPACAGKRRL